VDAQYHNSIVNAKPISLVVSDDESDDESIFDSCCGGGLELVRTSNASPALCEEPRSLSSNRQGVCEL